MAMRQAASAMRCWGLRFQPQAFMMAQQLKSFSGVDSSAKYAQSHEWAKAEGDMATVGISDHAQAELGDVVYVELPEVGSTVTKGETFGVVESVKAASDVYAPVSGEVVEINQALVEEPAKINAEPHGAGWMIKVKMSSASDLDDLLDAAAYEKHIAH